VYVVPYDRAAAGELRLPFYRVTRDGALQPAELRADLAALHFDAIKIRTFRGALSRVLDPQQGVGSYLAAVRAKAAEFALAAETLGHGEMARVAWPVLPTSVLVDEIRRWWDAERTPWSRQIHGFYRVLGRGASWPLRAAWGAVAPAAEDPLVEFQRQQQAAVLAALEKMLGELQRLADLGNETLSPRLEACLRGHARAELLARVQAAQAALPAVDEDYRNFLRDELEAWKQANPRAVRFLQTLDHAAALARPAITVSLAVSGWVLAGDLVGQAAIHTASHLATEAAIAGGITGGGEALVNTTGEGVGQAAARLFRRLQTQYAQQRARWLAAWLERELLGDLLADLRRGAELLDTSAFREVEATASELSA
jgi:hypothetical protein